MDRGAQLLTSLAAALAGIPQSVTDLCESVDRPDGSLWINTSYVTYASRIQLFLLKVVKNHPTIVVDVTIHNSLTDIVGGGLYLGARTS